MTGTERRYREALESGDCEALAGPWEEAARDPGLERRLRALGERLWAEARLLEAILDPLAADRLAPEG